MTDHDRFGRTDHSPSAVRSPDVVRRRGARPRPANCDHVVGLTRSRLRPEGVGRALWRCQASIDDRFVLLAKSWSALARWCVEASQWSKSSASIGSLWRGFWSRAFIAS